MMRKRDCLRNFFHRILSRQESSRPQTQNGPASRQGSTEAIADQGGPDGRLPDRQTLQEIPPNGSGVTVSATISPAPRLQHSEAPPAPLTLSPSVSAEPPRNAPFAQALQKHINGLDEEEKKAFQDASNSIPDKNVLRYLKKLSDDHEQSSLLRRHSQSLTKFLGLLDRFLGGVGIAIQQTPDISSLVVGGVRLLVDLAKDFASFFDRLSRMMAEFDDFFDVLVEYAQTARDGSLMCTTLVAVYGDILKFYQAARRVFINRKQESKKHVSITVFFQSQWEPFEERFGGIQSDMRHHLQVLSHAATATMVGQLSLREDERKQRESVKDREDFLNWISTASYDEKHRAVYAKKHPGTNDWLLRTREFQQWLSSTKAALLWCYGKPGSGKSVLASHVIETILEQYGPDEEVGVCFAYYDYTQSASQRFDQIVLALIKQLCRKVATNPDAFKRSKQNGESPSTLANLSHFTTITSQFKKVFLIIDALDESLEDDERPQMLSLLAEALVDIPHIRVFVTSRREPDIVRKFEALGMPTIQVEAESVAADIEKYVTNEVSRLRSEKELYITNEEVAEEVVRTLTDKADGMFLWVNLQLKQLCKESQTQNDQDVEKALKSLPQGLEKTYYRVVKQIERGAESMKKLAVACFVWVFHAKTPLTMDQLRYAVAIDTNLRKCQPKPAQGESILNACKSMLEMDSQGIVRPIHYSVQEFFTKPANFDQSDFAILRDISSSMGTASPHPISSPTLPRERDSVAIWDYLKPGLDHIIAYGREGIDMETYMALYVAVHNFCTSQKAVGSGGFGANNGGINNRGGVPLPGEDLYIHIIAYLKENLRDVYKKSTKYADEALLTFYIKEWNRYTAAAECNNHLFRFLNRHWIKREIDEGKKNVYYIYTLHLVLWEEMIFRHEHLEDPSSP